MTLTEVTALLGMTFHKDKAGHWLPIIVQGDPRLPRPGPRVSVMDIKLSNKTRVKKNASILGSPGINLDEAARYEEAGLRDNIIPRGSSSRRPVSVASYVSSASQKSNDIIEAPGVVPVPKVVVNEAGVMPLPGNLDNAEDDSNIVQEEDPAEDDQNPDGLVRFWIILN